jgi:hypothetical protein
MDMVSRKRTAGTISSQPSANKQQTAGHHGHSHTHGHGHSHNHGHAHASPGRGGGGGGGGGRIVNIGEFEDEKYGKQIREVSWSMVVTLAKDKDSQNIVIYTGLLFVFFAFELSYGFYTHSLSECFDLVYVILVLTWLLPSVILPIDDSIHCSWINRSRQRSVSHGF